MEQLRNDEGCQLIIALTHMRVKHDSAFAEQVPGVDLVLGGHDHFYKIDAVTQKVKQEGWKAPEKEKIVPLVKSGTDFFDFSEINVTFQIANDEYQEIVEEITKGGGYTSTNPKVHFKREAEEDMSLLMHSEENQLMVHVNRIRLADYDFQLDQEVVAHE